MAKFYGAIGYAVTEETSPGVWVENIKERMYSGDLISNRRKLQTDGVNDGINVANDISIISDPFANINMYAIRYVIYQGVKWKVSNVEVRFPRLILTIGGLYNG